MESFKMSDLIKATNQEVYKALPIGPPDQNEVIVVHVNTTLVHQGENSLYTFISRAPRLNLIYMWLKFQPLRACFPYVHTNLCRKNNYL